VDQRSDIFSLGAVLYEMITGQLPFRGDHETAVMYSVRSEDSQPLQRFNRDATDELERIVRRALAKSPSERYQDVKHMLDDLRSLGSATPAAGAAKQPVRARSRRNASIAGAVAVVVIALVLAIVPRVFNTHTSPEGPVITDERKMIVVLPFENLGPPEDEYFADGMTEEITARLASVHGLGVIARTSAIRYKKTEKTVPQIGEELGVGYILEGTIRWQRTSESQSQVRVTPQLIRVSDATHLWAEIYQEEMTDIFQVQFGIAEEVARALDVALLERERQVLERKPTDNLAAYQAYLRGIDHYVKMTPYTSGDRRLALEMLERAVALDPEFASAYAALSQVHSAYYNFGFDVTDQRRSLAKAAADRALELDPDLPEARLALGYYYWCHKDYDRALAELAIAEEGLPNDSRIIAAVGYIFRRQGRFKEAADKLRAALKLSPHEDELVLTMGEVLLFLRDYEDAQRYVDLSLALVPDNVDPYFEKLWTVLLWMGDNERAREMLEEMPRKIADTEYTEWLTLDLCDRRYQAALDRLAPISGELYEDYGEVVPWILRAGMVYRLMREGERAHAAFDSARVLLEEKVREGPDDFRIRGPRGIAYAGLGRKEEAMREGKLGVELLPVSKDAIVGPSRLADLAVIYTMVGEYGAALDQIEHLLSIPCWFSVQLLRLDPVWDPLRELPRYERIVAANSEVGA
jgi:TolB-like protein